MVFRVFVEKRAGFDGEARACAQELKELLGISALEGVRIFNRYDVEGIAEDLFESCIPTVFSEPAVDEVYRVLPLPENAQVFAVEYLPGQFDQRADSAAECIQLISQGERPEVASARVYAIQGDITKADLEAIKHYLINPIEAREASLELPETLALSLSEPEPVEVLKGFRALTDKDLTEFIAQQGLAMDAADLKMCVEYFTREQRDPTITEIKMIDTYWSDHCRHTTFGTTLTQMQIEDERASAAYARYQRIREELGRTHKPECLMDMATLGARYLKERGIMTGLDESEEINACTVKVDVDVDGQTEPWLYLFKNETHNHPTEIEPFGGAATCLGGAIRDPLSGRSYVYQAMRVTGAANPLTPVSETMAGKLPQRKITTSAAAGYSSYGNQIGLATGQVSELYHPGYAAKRMEIGAVVGATPADHVRRETPEAGDVIILLGGKTGRDGIGGATGSSKAHSVDSLATCGAEVQKGNPPIERKIQRLFRRKDACRLIKRCNDFGAGGVSVAVGELADGLRINLDAVPKKYEGLDGTELAISESQERMACAVAAADARAFIAYAREENLNAVIIAEVTDDARVQMTWRGDVIVDIAREFLASNGAPKSAPVHVKAARSYTAPWSYACTEAKTIAEAFDVLVSDLNVASTKGLSERFDSTIGSSTVLAPFGGRRQATPALAMAAKLPVLGETTTVSGMAWGFNPYLSEADQYTGAYIAVVESLSKLIASGFDREQAYLTLQEYFPKLSDVPERWGMPTASVLGALSAQLDLEVGAIGGKDSMSGSFESLDVPATLVSFATAVGHAKDVMSPEFKAADDWVVLLSPEYDEAGIPTPDSMKAALDVTRDLIAAGAVRAVSTPGYGGVAEALFKMSLGNAIGVEFAQDIERADLFTNAYGSFVYEIADEDLFSKITAPVLDAHDIYLDGLGVTTDDFAFEIAGERIDLGQLEQTWEAPLEPVFPHKSTPLSTETITFDAATPLVYGFGDTNPRVVIPVFPGTNCEFDSARAWQRVGANPEIFVLNNLTPQDIAESARELARRIRESQIVMLPGGFSGGDEPDGSAKLITAVFRNPLVADAVRDLMQVRDGLMLGICNGFQALIKLGLVPYGDIIEASADSPTLTYNTIGRHQSGLVHTRVASNLSPWFSRMRPGDVHTIAISHGEGRLVAPEHVLAELKAAGQIATQYVNAQGEASMALADNPNGSMWAIEGITSPDGRILGKMGHTERTGEFIYKNVPGDKFQPLFEGGVEYFRG